MIRHALLAARTVRHLEPEQAMFQVLRRIQGTPTPRETPLDVPVDYQRLAILRERFLTWGAPGAADVVLNRARRSRSGELTFVGATETLAAPDWNREYVSRLWTYN